MADDLTPPAAEPTPPPVPTPPPAPPTTPWYQGKADQDLTNHLVHHGWDRDDPVTAAMKAAQSHRALMQHFGLSPSARGDLMMVQPNDPESIAKVYEKLGVPKDPKEYDFSTVKFADGSELDDKFVDFVRGQAAALHMNKNDALALAQSLTKFADADESSDLAETTAVLQEQKAELAKNWGANYEANMFVAKNTALKLGVTPEAVSALENAIGYNQVMEMFRTIGTKIGEDAFIRGNSPTGGGIMTRTEAVAKKAELMSDQAWRARYLGGGKAELREMMGLSAIISGGDVPKVA